MKIDGIEQKQTSTELYSLSANSITTYWIIQLGLPKLKNELRLLRKKKEDTCLVFMFRKSA